MNVFVHPTDNHQRFRPPPGHPAYPRWTSDMLYLAQSGRQAPTREHPLCRVHGSDGCPHGANEVKMHYAPEYYKDCKHPSPGWVYGHVPLCNHAHACTDTCAAAPLIRKPELVHYKAQDKEQEHAPNEYIEKLRKDAAGVRAAMNELNALNSANEASAPAVASSTERGAHANLPLHEIIWSFLGGPEWDAPWEREPSFDLAPQMEQLLVAAYGKNPESFEEKRTLAHETLSKIKTDYDKMRSTGFFGVVASAFVAAANSMDASFPAPESVFALGLGSVNEAYNPKFDPKLTERRKSRTISQVACVLEQSRICHIPGGHAIAHDLIYDAVDMAVLGSLGIHAFRAEDDQFHHTVAVHSELGRSILHEKSSQYPPFLRPAVMYCPALSFDAMHHYLETNLTPDLGPNTIWVDLLAGSSWQREYQQKHAVNGYLSTFLRISTRVDAPLSTKEQETLAKSTVFYGLRWIPEDKAKELLSKDAIRRDWAPEDKQRLPKLLFDIYHLGRRIGRPLKLQQFVAKRRAHQIQSQVKAKGQQLQATAQQQAGKAKEAVQKKVLPFK